MTCKHMNGDCKIHQVRQCLGEHICSDFCKPEDKLTPEQILKWKLVFVGLIGPMAHFLTDEDVQRLRNQYQERINQEIEA